MAVSAAFDVNPNVDKSEHVLNIDDSDNRPNLKTVLSSAAFYGLTTDQAQKIIDDITAMVCNWRQLAKKFGISNADIELTAAAFYK